MKAKVTIEIFVEDGYYESNPEEKQMRLDSLKLSAEIMHISPPSGYNVKNIAVSVQELVQVV